jgi:trk system potassium uptake protein TrkH
VGTIIILAAEYNHALRDLTPAHKLLAAYFQSVTPRTAGFNTIDLNTLLLPTQLLIIALMFIGGSPGSTAGGIKTATFTILLVAIFSILRGKKDTEIFKRRIEANEVLRALAIALLSISVVFIMTFLISFSNHFDLVRILFEVVSALGTVGLSLSLTPSLNDMGRILLIITMFLGRLGPATIGYALVFRQQQAQVRYPEGKIIIG